MWRSCLVRVTLIGPSLIGPSRSHRVFPRRKWTIRLCLLVARSDVAVSPVLISLYSPSTLLVRGNSVVARAERATTLVQAVCIVNRRTRMSQSVSRLRGDLVRLGGESVSGISFQSVNWIEILFFSPI